MTKLNRQQFVEKLKDIKLLALDVDGVLTDDGIYFGPDGFELKKFNTSDGLFIVLALRTKLKLAIVSGRYSKATDTRMKDLGVKHVLQGMKDKVEMITPLIEKLNLSFDQVAFVGNELLDIKLAVKCGIGIAVGDSCRELIEAADYVTEHKGGDCAVREVIEAYFDAVGIDPQSLLE